MSNISGDKSENCQGKNDYWIVKLNVAGDIVWQSTIGGSDEDYLRSIQQTSDGGYILGGNSTSNIGGNKSENSQGKDDYWIVKLDATGDIRWQKTIGGSEIELFGSVQQSIDNRYIMSGASLSGISGSKAENSKGLWDYWVVMLSPCPPPCTLVITPSDTGPGSLRAAIDCANANPGPDTIRFNIPGAGPHILAPLTALPIISDDSLVIDATTQPGWVAGNVVLDGTSQAGQSPALNVNRWNDTLAGFELYGLTIRNFADRALTLSQVRNIVIGAPGKGNTFYSNALNPQFYAHHIALQDCSNGKFQGNIVGLKEDYTIPAGSSSDLAGLAGELRDFLIGGDRTLDEGNVFGNCYHAINLWDNPGAFVAGNIQVFGNDIGRSPAGADAGTTNHSILVGAIGGGAVRIGDGTAGRSNRIEHNLSGIFVSPGGSADISFNRFACNDFGINAPQTAPLISAAGPLSITGTAAAGSRVEVYRHQICGNAECQGSDYLGAITADATGQWTLLAPFATGLNSGDKVTATATLNNKTSDFAACLDVNNGCDPVSDSLELVKLYDATNGSGWLNNTNWKVPGKALDDWYGISTLGGCVFTVNLGANQLGGYLPDLNLPQVRFFYLDDNDITGSIPLNLNMPVVQHFWLFGNNFTGTIPALNMPNLEYLWLSENRLEGKIPDFSGHDSLRIIWVDNNLLEGPMPNLAPPNLESVWVHTNKLTFNGLPEAVNKNYQTFWYDPQDSVFHDTLIIRNVGEDVDLPLDFDENVFANEYRWYQDGNPKPQYDKTGDNHLSISNLKLSDTGEWRVRVTNQGASDLTLHSRAIRIQVNCVSAPTPAIIGPSVLCSGAATLSVSDTYTDWKWSNNQTGTNAITVNMQETFTVTVTDANGCTGTDSHTLNGNVPAPAPAIDGPSALCSGAATLSASDTYSDWKWSNNQTGTNAITVNTQETFTVTVTDANGCTGTDSHTLNGNVPAPSPSIDGPSALCSGAATLTVTGIYSDWKWSNNQTGTNVITVITLETFTVTVTDANGCTGTDSHSLNGNVPAPSPVIDGPTALCSGAATLTVTGTYSDWKWSNNQTGTNAITVNDPGIYTVTVTDFNGCTGTGSTTVDASNDPLPLAAQHQPVSQPGASDGIGVIHLQGVASPYSLNWSGPVSGSLAGQTADSVFIGNLAAGDYFVTVTDANGCTGTAFFSIVLDNCAAAPAAQIQSDSLPCTGNDLQLRETGGQAVAWAWAGPNNFSATAQNPVVPALTSLASGDYRVTVTDANGCTAIAVKTITALPVPVTQIFANPGQLCEGEDIQLGDNGSGGAAWQWQGPNGFVSTQQSPLIQNAGNANSGVYNLLVRHANGCTDTASVEIHVFVHYSREISASVCAGESYEFCDKVYTKPGTYTCDYTTVNYCDSVITLNLTVLPLPQISTLEDTITLPAGASELVILAAQNDVVPPNNLWDFDIIAKPAAGSVEISDTVLVYRLNQQSFSGLDSFRYRICSRVCANICDSAWVRLFIPGNQDDSLKRFLTNVLTPGLEDGINDLFDPVEAFIKNNYPVSKATLSIYNRTGMLIYREESERPTWNGQLISGALAPQAPYFYAIEAEVGADRPRTVWGIITVLR